MGLGGDDREIKEEAKKLLNRRNGNLLAVSLPVLGELRLLIGEHTRQECNDALARLDGWLRDGTLVTYAFGTGRAFFEHLNGVLDSDGRLDPNDAVIVACMATDEAAISLRTTDRFVSSVGLRSYLKPLGKTLLPLD